MTIDVGVAETADEEQHAMFRLLTVRPALHQGLALVSVNWGHTNAHDMLTAIRCFERAAPTNNDAKVRREMNKNK
jgi:hypothetical protein